MAGATPPPGAGAPPDPRPIGESPPAPVGAPVIPPDPTSSARASAAPDAREAAIPLGTPPAAGARRTDRWQDFLPRFISGAVLALVGLVCIWLGGWVFLALVTLVIALMVWELQHIVSLPQTAPVGVLLAGLAGLAVFLWGVLPIGFVLPFALLPAMLGIGNLPQNRTLFAVYSSFMILAGFGLLHLRQDYGFAWLLWLVLVVVATDVFGYFAGRIIGGPKFWPKVSPKKTWSGTTAGWIAAALVGVAFVLATGARWELVGVSVAVSMASQLGDVTESALKRRMGVKDSSNLIPGHGGVMDRFDAMLGASVFLLLVERLVDFNLVVLGL